MRVMILAIAFLIALGAVCQAQEENSMTTANALARAAKRVSPEYPIAARQLNIQGQQEVAIVVNAQGDVSEAKVMKGNAMFTSASVAAAKQWKFSPLTKDGQPMGFTTVLIFSYTK
ncbi:energy transducer TonB [Paludibaculum fermentans]|uniref:energy transducer TonB n=1 Tax=Paludibaculum fermentans TaxID=1473598 RepID=UPI003EB6A594